MRQIITVATFVLAVLGCRSLGSGASDVRVVGGTLVEQNDEIVLSTVGLIWDNENNHTNGCSGVLISKRMVLTAAHCFTAAGKVENLTITFGLQREGDHSIQIAASNFLLYGQDHGKSLEDSSVDLDDIAIVTMSADAPKDYLAVDLIATNAEINAGDTLTIAGFGSTGADVRDAGVLRMAKLTVSSIMVEEHFIRFVEHAFSNEFKGSCFGDSGGPAFLKVADRSVVAGIAHGGDYRCRERSLYTDIRPYSAWINSKIMDI